MKGQHLEAASKGVLCATVAIILTMRCGTCSLSRFYQPHKDAAAKAENGLKEK